MWTFDIEISSATLLPVKEAVVPQDNRNSGYQKGSVQGQSIVLLCGGNIMKEIL
jgi:hypothetical protein